ncbi:M56 family metallopeptidase [Chitinophaga vietnamensis]|uniref:M56 family metallopeptidase n=1 Tax=Chitinophaga vietnamensis TaxID=2593957 RepID=UPI00117805C4|nr:M56 family metallopeptidase [Chitinophaga vietnamensis]
MATLLSYFVQASCCMAVFYLLYVLVFRRETFYRYNRLLLLSAFLFSAILPLLPLPSLRTIAVEAPGQQVIVQLHDIPTAQHAAPQTNTGGLSIGWPQLIIGLYAGVAITLLLVYLVQLLRIARLIKKGAVQRYRQYSFVQLSGLTTPFSFLRYIFIDTNRYASTDLQHVVAHEKAHVLQHHSIDNLVASLCCCLFWLNPFAWLLKKSLQLNLEFLADEAALLQEPVSEDYQYCLLRVGLQYHAPSVAHHFSKSFIKNRIFMINKSRSRRNRTWMYLLVLPVLFGTSAAIAYTKPATIKASAALNRHLAEKNQTIYGVITCKTTAADIQEMKQQLGAKGHVLTVDDIAYNKKGEIKQIVVKISNTAGTTWARSNRDADGEKAISPVFFYTSQDKKSVSDGFGVDDYPASLRSLAAQESGDQAAGPQKVKKQKA